MLENDALAAAVPPVRIATRSSPLALWQANELSRLLRAAHLGVGVELVPVSTVGDRDRATALAAMGGQGVFTREVQAAVLDGRADLAVHSLKDLPTQPTPGLMLACVPDRAATTDWLVLPLNTQARTAEQNADQGDAHHGDDGDVPASDVEAATLEGAELAAWACERLACLGEAATVGTGSPRRAAQLRHWRSDLKITPIRGNVETRLKKLDQGEYAAIVLAAAGLSRLGLVGRPVVPLVPPLMFPAVGQGALGIESRSDDARCSALLRPLENVDVRAHVDAERALLRALQAGCHAPVGVYVETRDDTLAGILHGMVLSLDGQTRLTASIPLAGIAPDAAGIELADALLSLGAGPLIAGHAVQ